MRLCNNDLENIELYKNLMITQIEKMYISAEFDEEKDAKRKEFSLFVTFTLYKILIEIGIVTGDYFVSIEEFRIFIGTIKKYEESLEAVIGIITFRENQDFKKEILKYKDKVTGNRYNLSFGNLPYFDMSENKITLKTEYIEEIKKKIFIFENSNYILTRDEVLKYLIKPIHFLDISLENLLKQKEKSQKMSIKNDIDFPHNRILYGAPGTGKSYLLKKQVEENFNNSERVTFYDGYTYGQFVGMYKPIPDEDDNITYKYIPGSFMRLLVAALKSPEENFCLIIEELNRAKADKVFGNIFQLLDRDDENRSNYSIAASEDQIGYLEVVLKDNSEILNSILEKGLYIPNNFYIWSTMNSADQGVYPLDSAFKRRWSFEHVGLNENEKEFEIGKYFVTYKLDELDKDNKEVIESEKEIEWNTFRRKINEILLEKKFPEDRLLAPFFISKKDFKLEDSRYLLNQEVFLNKILVYLFDDILRHKDKELLFSGNCLSFSSLKNIFNEGKNIFNFSFDNINTSDELEKENE